MRKVLALILSFCLMLSLFPFSFAYGDEEAVEEPVEVFVCDEAEEALLPEVLEVPEVAYDIVEEAAPEEASFAAEPFEAEEPVAPEALPEEDAAVVAEEAPIENSDAVTEIPEQEASEAAAEETSADAEPSAEEKNPEEKPAPFSCGYALLETETDVYKDALLTEKLGKLTEEYTVFVIDRIEKDDENPEEDALKALFFMEGETEEGFIPAIAAAPLDASGKEAYLETLETTQEQYTDYELKSGEHIFLYPCEYTPEFALEMNENISEVPDIHENILEGIVEPGGTISGDADLLQIALNAMAAESEEESLEEASGESEEQGEIVTESSELSDAVEPASDVPELTDIVETGSGGTVAADELLPEDQKEPEEEELAYSDSQQKGSSGSQAWKKKPSLTVKQDKVQEGLLTVTIPECKSYNLYAYEILVTDSYYNELAHIVFDDYGKVLSIKDKSVPEMPGVADTSSAYEYTSKDAEGCIEKAASTWTVSFDLEGKVNLDRYFNTTLHVMACYVGYISDYSSTIDIGAINTKNIKLAPRWSTAPKILTLKQTSAVAPVIQLSWSFIGNPSGFYIYDKGYYLKSVTTGRSGESLNSVQNCSITLSGTGSHSIQVVPYRNGYLGKTAKKSISIKTDWMKKALTVTAAQPSYGQVRLSWKPLDGINDYYIYEYFGKTAYIMQFHIVDDKGTKKPVSGSSVLLTGVSSGTHKFGVAPYYNGTLGKLSAKSVKVGSGKLTPAAVKYRALCIGNTYSNNNIVSTLPGCATDATTMSGMLKSMSATPYTVTVKQNQTAGQIISDIASAFSAATKDDVSLFSYSGHGCSTGNLYGNDGSELSIAQLRSALDQIPGKKIVLLDCCYSGQSINKDGKVVEEEVTDEMLAAFSDAVIAAFYDEGTQKAGELAASSYYVMTACSKNQTSLEISLGKKRGGLFTSEFEYACGWDEETNKKLSWLPSDSNYDGYVTMNEAYQCVSRWVGSRQTTRVYPEGSGQIIAGRK